MVLASETHAAAIRNGGLMLYSPQSSADKGIFAFCRHPARMGANTGKLMTLHYPRYKFAVNSCLAPPSIS
jgi:hypothetical protein